MGGVITVILMDAGLLAAGIPAERRQGRDMEEVRTARVTALKADLPALQKKSDDARQAIFNATEAMDELLELGMQVSGIGKAQEKFPRGAELMDAARRANATLVPVTDEIIARATQGVSDADWLKSRVEQDDARYLKAWRKALQAMIDAHTIYAGMNAALSNGLSVYEELFTMINEFLTRQKSRFFRSLKEAAGSFTLQVEKYLPRIDAFKTELQNFYEQAQEATARAEDAFSMVDKLSQR